MERKGKKKTEGKVERKKEEKGKKTRKEKLDSGFLPLIQHGKNDLPAPQ